MDSNMEMKIEMIPGKDYKELIEKFSKLQTDLNERDLKISELENEILEWNGKEWKRTFVNTSNREMCENQINELKQSLISKENSIKEKDKIIDEYKQKLARFHETNDENKIRKLEREIRILKRNAEENSQEFQECESLKDELVEKCKLLRKELKQCKCENKEELQKYFDEIKGLKQSLKSRENSIKEKDEIIEKYKQKLAEFQEKSGLQILVKNRIKSFDEEIEKQNTKIRNLNEEMRNLKSDNERKQQAIVNMRDKIRSSFEGRIDQSEMKKLQNQIRAKDLEIEQLHGKVKNLNEAIDKNCTEYELVCQKVIQLESEIDRMKRLKIFGSSQNAKMPR